MWTILLLVAAALVLLAFSGGAAFVIWHMRRTRVYSHSTYEWTAAGSPETKNESDYDMAQAAVAPTNRTCFKAFSCIALDFPELR